MRTVWHDLPVFVFPSDVLNRLNKNPNVGAAAGYMENQLFEKIDEIKALLNPTVIVESIPFYIENGRLYWRDKSFELKTVPEHENLTKISFISISMGSVIDKAYDEASSEEDSEADIIEAIGQSALLQMIDYVRDLLSQTFYDEGLECAVIYPIYEIMASSDIRPFWQYLEKGVADMHWVESEILSPRLSYGLFMFWQKFNPDDPLFKWMRKLTEK